MLSIKIQRGVEMESSDWRVISERIRAIGRLQTLKVLHCCSVFKDEFRTPFNKLYGFYPWYESPRFWCRLTMKQRVNKELEQLKEGFKN